jgi:hypothetical protein
MKLYDIVKKAGYETTKQVAQFVAPLAAVSSMAGKGGNGVLDNLVAIYHVPAQLFYTGKAFITNEGVRDFTLNRLGEVLSIIGSAAKNIVERPIETFGVAATVYVAVKYSPQIVKYISTKLKQRKGKKIGSITNNDVAAA